MKLDKMPNIIYGDNVSLIKKIDNCKKNTEKSSTAKIGKKFLVDIQGQLFGLLIIEKISIVYILKKTVLKSFVNS